MRRNGNKFIFTVILAVICTLFFRPECHIAQAEDLLTIKDGVYQVELSFQSSEVQESESFFGEKATLTIQKGTYTLAVPMDYADQMTVNAVEQSNKSLPFLMKDNLIQFDLVDLQRVIQLEGLLNIPFEGKVIPFKMHLTIDSKSLPQIEVPEIKPPPITTEDEEKEPSRPVIEEKPKEVSLRFQLLVDGKKEPSVMNTYVNPILKVIKVDGHYDVKMKIVKSAWITGLKIEHNGEMIEPETISLIDNSRTIRFTVKNLKEKKTIWVKVDIPEINYHHDYQVQLVFDEGQVADLIGKSENPVKPEVSEPKPDKIAEQVSNDVGKEKASAPIVPTLGLPVHPVVVTPAKKPQIEDILAFDRTIDERIEEVHEDLAISKNEEVQIEQQPVTTDLKRSTDEKVKLGLLIVAFVGSGFLLIHRITRTKKHSASE